MAITRIKNNQITDATIVGSTKLVDYSVTGVKLANSLTYGSDLTISGNLTVNGTTSTIDTTTTTIEDAVIVLASTQTSGAPGADIGILGRRGEENNVVFIWDESAEQFAFAFSEDPDNVGPNITLSARANLSAGTGDFDTLAGNLVLSGETPNAVVFLDANGQLTTDPDFTFDGSALDLTGSLTVDDVTLDGNAVTGNSGLTLTTTGDGNISIVPGGNGSVTIENLAIDGMTANSVVHTDANGVLVTTAGLTYNGTTLTAGNVSVAGDSVSGSGALTVVATGNLVLDPTANVIVDTATATQVFFAGAAKELVGAAGLTFDGTTLTSTGGVQAGNVSVAGNAVAAVGTDPLAISSANGNVVVAGVNVLGSTISSVATDSDIVLDPNGTGVVDVSTSRITNVVDPTAAQDAATKAYVDSQIGAGSSLIQQGDSSVSVVDTGTGIITTTVDDTPVITSTAVTTTFTQGVVVDGELDVDNININGDTISSDGNLVLATPDGELIVATMDEATQVFFAGANGELTTDISFKYDSGVATLYVQNVVQVRDQFRVESMNETEDNLRITGSSVVAESSNLMVASEVGDITLYVPDENSHVIVDSTHVAATGVFYAGADKEMLADANLTFNGSALALTGTANITGALTVDNVTIDGDTISAVEDLNILATNGNINITPDAANGVVNITNLTLAGMAANRVVFTETDGTLKTDGNIQFDGDDLTVIGSATVDNIKIDGNTINTTVENQQLRIDANGTGDFYVDRNVTVSGNLSVLGTTTTVDSIVVTIQDPIIELGRGANNTPLTSNDGKDRGVRLWYYDVGADEEQSAWMGYDHPTEEFRYFSDASITDEEVTGTLGTVNVGKVIVDNVTIDGSAIQALGQLQILSGLNSDLTLQAGGTGVVLVPSGDQFRVADLDTNRVVFTTTGGELVTDADLTFDGANLVLAGKATIDNVTIDGSSISGAGGLNLASTADGNVSIVPNGNGVVNVDGLAVDGTTISSVATDSNIVLDPNGTGVVDVSTSRITNVVDPTAAQDAATKAYVDGAIGTGGSIIQQGDSSVSVVDAGTGTVTTTVDGDAVIVSNATTTTFTQAVVVNGSLAVDNVTVDNNTVSTSVGDLFLTSATGNVVVAAPADATEVFFAGASGEIVSSTAFRFDVDNSNVIVDGNAEASGRFTAGDSLWVSDVVSITSSEFTSTLGGYTISVLPNDGAAHLTLYTEDGNVQINTASVQEGGVFFAGDNKALVTSEGFVYDADNAIVSAGTFTAVGSENVSLTATGVDSTGALEITSGNNGNINITPDGTGVVNITNLAIAGLDANRVVVTDALGAFVDSDAFTFSVASNALVLTGSAAIDNVTIDGDSVTGAANLTVVATGNLVLDPTANVIVDTSTANQVFYAGAAKELIGDANLTFDGSALTVVGSATVDNVVVDGDDITSTNGVVTVNGAAGDVDFVVAGDTNASLFVVDAGTDSVVVGSAVTTADVTFKIDATDSMIVPVGTTGQRPAVGVAGMLRFNETIGEVEVFDGTVWDTIGTEFTLIASQTFNGDGSTDEFTLSTAQTTASCIVSINGVVQLPSVAYAVSGTTLAFTEAPADGDVVEVRQLTTTTTFSVEVVNSQETARVAAVEGAAQINVTGNLLPTSNEVFDLGSSSFRWHDLYLAGTTIDLGGVLIKNEAGSIKFYETDGTTPAAFSGILGGDVSLDGGEY